MKTYAKFLSRFLLIVGMVLVAQSASAGIFGDLSTYWQERSRIKSASKNVVSGVREIYRERTSIRSFTESARELVSAFHSIKDKKANIAQIVNIAKNIDVLARSYNTLAPKATAMYSKLKPDLDYFSQIKGEEGDFKLQVGSKELLVKTLSDSRVDKLSGAAGWSRVWDTIKDNPMNVFRWGRLKDEYDYGKMEGKYALKCTQIAFEGASYYSAAQSYMKDLLDIRQQINGIVSGDWSAIIGLPNTLNSIQGAAVGVNDFGALLNTAAGRMSKHLDDLGKMQNDYVTLHRNYAAKYLQEGTAAGSTTSASSGVSTGSTTPTGSTGTIAGGYTNLDLQKAMTQYQNTYKAYASVISNPSASERDKQVAVANLQKAKAHYDSVKSALGQ